MSKSGSSLDIVWGRDDTSVIDAIPKDKAEKMFEILRKTVDEAKKTKSAPTTI